MLYMMLIGLLRFISLLDDHKSCDPRMEIKGLLPLSVQICVELAF